MSKKSIIGEINTSLNGLRMIIIASRNDNDLDVQFEDGTIVKNKTYALFSKGEIIYPKFVGGDGNYKENSHNYNFRASSFHDFTKLKEAFRTQGKVFYYCEDKNGISELFTPQKMMERSGIKPIF